MTFLQAVLNKGPVKCRVGGLLVRDSNGFYAIRSRPRQASMVAVIGMRLKDLTVGVGHGSDHRVAIVLKVQSCLIRFCDLIQPVLSVIGIRER